MMPNLHIAETMCQYFRPANYELNLPCFDRASSTSCAVNCLSTPGLATPPVATAANASVAKPMPPATSCFQYETSAAVNILTDRNTHISSGLTFCLNFNQLDARIFRAASMNSVAQVTEPGLNSLPVHVLNPRVLVTRCDRLAGNGNPVGVTVVLKREGDIAVRLQVVKLLRIRIADEQEVRSRTLCDSH